MQGSLTVGPDGSVYVADTGNFRVQVFTPAGGFVRSIGEFGNGPGQFTWPFDLAVDADGNVYVADDKEQTLAKLSPSGRQLWRRGGSPRPTSGFRDTSTSRWSTPTGGCSPSTTTGGW